MKKAELSITVIVGIILALIVLVILVIAFREQIGQLLKSFSNLITTTTGSESEIGAIR